MRLDDTPTALSDDLEERTETLSMIVDTLNYTYEHRPVLRACPYGTLFVEPENGGLTGFVQSFDGGILGDCESLQTFETRASADVAALKADGAKLVQRARLAYGEKKRATGNPWTEQDTCVGEVQGILGTYMQDDKTLLNTYDGGAARIDDASWDVTGLVRSWFTGAAENHGLVLVGQKEAGEFGEETTACLSAVTNLRLEVTVMSNPDPFDAAMLPHDLVIARTPTRTPGPIERDKQDVDVDLLTFKTATPSPATTMAPTRTPDLRVVTKPGGDSQLVRAITSTPTRTPEPAFVPKPQSPFIQQAVLGDD